MPAYKPSPEAVQFLAGLGISPDHPFAGYDATCGLHSGFPPCCVAFYIMIWQPLHHVSRSLAATHKVRTNYSEGIETVAALRKVDVPEYIPCPACTASGNFVEVKPCGCRFLPAVRAVAEAKQSSACIVVPGPEQFASCDEWRKFHQTVRLMTDCPLNFDPEL